jgi:predicted homoserine dehydrogenase-like protein
MLTKEDVVAASAVAEKPATVAPVAVAAATTTAAAKTDLSDDEFLKSIGALR